MQTPDGISSEDWDLVHELAIEIVNATKEDEEAAYRRRLLDYLDELEAKYGALPSILATRADYVDVDDVPSRLDLLLRSYSSAVTRGDVRNQLYVALSLAALYVDELEDVAQGRQWLARAREHLTMAGNEVDVREYERIMASLCRLDSNMAGGDSWRNEI